MPTVDIPRVELVSERILCTPLLPEHAEDQVEAILESAEALAGSMPWYHEGFGIDEARWWTIWCKEAWEAGTHYEFAVVDRAAGAYLGACGLGGVDRDLLRANLQYWTRTSATRTGVASTAARLVSEWGVKELGLMRIEVSMPASNVSSRKTAERAGATLEGLLRNQMRWEGKSHDAYVLSFTPEDFR